MKKEQGNHDDAREITAWDWLQVVKVRKKWTGLSHTFQDF